MAKIKKVKKAQFGDLDNYKEKERGNMTKIKGTAPSGNYKVKVKSITNDDGTISTTSKARRTLKGLLSGASRIPNKTITKKPEMMTARMSTTETAKKGSTIKKGMHKMPNGSMMKNSAMKAKNGKSFPDLNKDGKISKADILVGKGVVKAQTGKTVMQKLKAKYPSADTTAAGDTRFQEYNAYAPKKFINQIQDTDKAFDKKYGKGKPAKNKNGGVTKAKVKVGSVDPKGAYTKVQKRTLAGAKASVPSKKK
jgi:hypothetical protein